MTLFKQPGGKTLIKWDPGDAVDWTTPNVGDGIDDEYCGNCGLDFPGCGCPRDCGTCQEQRAYCGHLAEVADTEDSDDWEG